LTKEHQAQVINYVKATGIEVGMLINFGNSKLEYRRFENKFLEKKSIQDIFSE
jgi:GxxExxY protein